MLNKDQIKLVQTAVRAAGLRTKYCEGRYRLLLGQYMQSNGRPVTSCKQLNNSQLEDLLAICEAHGWRMPGKPDDFYRQKINNQSDIASFAQQSAIRRLAGDLGWNEYQLAGMVKKITNGQVVSPCGLSPKQAYQTIEALKSMLSRTTGKNYNNLKEIEKDFSGVKDDGRETSKVS